jgi:hypothetical protein
MAPDADRPFILKWSRPFPDDPKKQDFTGKDLQRPDAFARVYFQDSHPDPSRRWFWTVSGSHQIALGHEATTRAAARAAEAAYSAWLAAQ